MVAVLSFVLLFVVLLLLVVLLLSWRWAFAFRSAAFASEMRLCARSTNELAS